MTVADAPHARLMGMRHGMFWRTVGECHLLFVGTDEASKSPAGKKLPVISCCRGDLILDTDAGRVIVLRIVSKQEKVLEFTWHCEGGGKGKGA